MIVTHIPYFLSGAYAERISSLGERRVKQGLKVRRFIFISALKIQVDFGRQFKRKVINGFDDSKAHGFSQSASRQSVFLTRFLCDIKNFRVLSWRLDVSSA